MTAPSYKTNDPKGWCGDPRRGAAMGRPAMHKTNKDVVVRFYLRKQHLDSGGYDRNGTYFGSGAEGEELYWYASSDGEVDSMLRAGNRPAAKAQVQKLYPKATFFN